MCTFLLSRDVPLQTVAKGRRVVASEGWHGFVTDLDGIQVQIFAKAKAADNVATEQRRNIIRQCLAAESLPPEVAEDGRATSFCGI